MSFYTQEQIRTATADAEKLRQEFPQLEIFIVRGYADIAVGGAGNDSKLIVRGDYATCRKAILSEVTR